MLTKRSIREAINRRRKALREREIIEKSAEILRRLEGEIPESAETFMFYAPVRGEANILPLAEELLKAGKTVVFPRVVGDEIVPFRVSSLSELTPGTFSIPEPPMDPERIPESIDVAFVPGVAFDLSCNRLGHGTGFYDRFLAKWRVKAKIGICFDFQVVDRIPVEPFDVPVDTVVTEKRKIRRS